MKRIIYLLAMVFGFFVTSCETADEPKTEFSPVYPLSGEWWVTYKVNGTDALNLYYTKLFTYNTAENVSTEMWMNTSNAAFALLVKSATDVNNKSFVASSVTNSNSGGAAKVKTVSIQNGKVIPNGGKSTTGVVVDSIYFELTVDDAALTQMGLPAGSKIVVSGKRRTGWLEDDF